MAMASRASVTVSMAEDMIGRFSSMSRVSRVLMDTPDGMTSEWPGRSSTSSNVSASVRWGIPFIASSVGAKGDGRVGASGVGVC